MTKDNEIPLQRLPSGNLVAAGESVPVLVELKGDLRQSYLVTDRCVIGRSPECSIWIMDRLVSRRHAEIRRADTGDFRIFDLGSKFGTYLNREAIVAETLRPGDQVFVGSTLLRFEERPASKQCIRRRQNRLSCHLSVRVTFNDEVVETVATDISLGGLRLDWGRSPGLGTAMRFEITVPGRDKPLLMAGHANHKSDDTGLGVRFYYTSEEDELELAEVFAQLYLASTDSSND